MTKSQLLILLLIIALVFYYLNEENQPANKPKSSEEPWLIVKKPTKPQLPKTKTTFPKPPTKAVNIQPPEPKTPNIYYFPSAEEIEPKTPTNFGLNPPHSQLNFPKAEIIQEPTSPLEINCPAAETIPEPEFLATDNSLNETYRQRFLTLLSNLPLSLLTQQATEALQAPNQPLANYFQAIWKLKGLSNFKEQIAQPLREWINLTNSIKPSSEPLDYGWLTDDNLEFILNNYQPIQSALTKTKSFHLRTDIANIYNSFSKAKSNQDWELPEFLQRLELNKAQYTLFPLRVSGNHWGLFILHNLTWQELEANYVVYYTSSGGMSLEQEKQQLQPFINQICGQNTPIQILPPKDRQSKGYECGVYLVFYLQEILETTKLELQRTHSSGQCQQFRWAWKTKIGENKWCQT